jgi:hypothetical protein
MKYYSFDLRGYKVRELIAKWTKIYPHNWLPLGVTEAIYQGRLKAVSVEQILNVWSKKGEINQSFNHEFCRLIKPDITLSLEEDQELKYIFSNVHNSENLTSTNNNQEILEENDLLEIKKFYSNEDNKNVNDDNKNAIEGDKIKFKSSVNNFQPLDDYSQCFQKLKAFIAINN